MDKGGFETGEMQRLQMIKIEELYLYVIELNKKLEKLEKENKKLHAKIKDK
jgi:sulfur transfer protein SufE